MHVDPRKQYYNIPDGIRTYQTGLLRDEAKTKEDFIEFLKLQAGLSNQPEMMACEFQSVDTLKLLRYETYPIALSNFNRCFTISFCHELTRKTTFVVEFK